MEGRRVTHQAPQRNPLYVLFLCLLAAVFVLAVIAIVLGARLSSTRKALERAQTQVEELKAQLREGSQTGEPDGTGPADEPARTDPEPPQNEDPEPSQTADPEPAQPG